MTKSTKSRQRNKSEKPAKPYPEFPLFPHATKRWAKKIRGKFHYFGPWDDPDAALQKYLDQKDDLHAGRTPRPQQDGLTVAEMCDAFWRSKKRLFESGDITQRTFTTYESTTDRIVEMFGKNRLVDDLTVEDFERFREKLSKGRGPVSLGNEIRKVRIVLKYAYDAGLVDRPVRVGPTFKVPSKSVMRRERAKRGKRMFDADELRMMLDGATIAADDVDGDDETEVPGATQPLRAMILLAINGGFGQTDIANLPASAVDLDAGWIDYPRPKTGIERRVPLWPETVDALREAIAMRPKPKNNDDSACVFLTKAGNRWVRTNENGTNIDSVGLQFSKLLCNLDINGHRKFYALRHTFRTIADEAKDQPAVTSLMGHADNSMAGLYREYVADERLQAVAEYVRGWLFGDDAES